MMTWRRALLSVSGLIVLFGGGAVTAAAAPAPVPAVAADAATGMPAITADSPVGYYIWFDGDQIHLRTHDHEDGAVYTGTVRANGDITITNLIHAEANDGAVAADRTLRFHFHTHAGVDGVSFRIAHGDCATFRLDRDDHLITPDRIYLGAGLAHPPGNPFQVCVG
jgi:hypothetical protein